MKKILVTGFEAFGGETVNATGAVLARLPETLEGCLLETVTLPVSFRRADAALRSLLEEKRPDAVLCLGQYAGSSTLHIERVGLNVGHSGADNDGDAPHHRPLAEGRPDAYFTRLPIDALLNAIHAAGVPAEISNTAGTYVCNCVMFTLLDAMALGASPAIGGFIHIPAMPSQAIPRNLPSMATETAFSGIMAALIVMAQTITRE